MLFHQTMKAEGEKVRLETALRRDAVPILRSWEDSAVRDSLHHTKPRSLEDEKAYLEEIEASPSDHVFKVIRVDDDKLIGTCGLHEFHGHVLSARIGFCILCEDPCMEECMEEAIVLARSAAYERLGLRCVYLHVLATDLPTHLKLKRIGFIPATNPLPVRGHKGRERIAIYMEHQNPALLG